jgi:hypothetical protein
MATPIRFIQMLTMMGNSAVDFLPTQNALPADAPKISRPMTHEEAGVSFAECPGLEQHKAWNASPIANP